MALVLFSLLLSIAFAPFSGYYPIVTPDELVKTVNVQNGLDVGSCSCNLVANSCDSSCCCDPDCPQATLDLWLSDATAFCNANVNTNLKPLTKCLDANIMGFWNK